MKRQNGTSSDVVIALTTFDDREKARQFGAILVEKQLVACVNLIGGVESIYRWKGQIERDDEILAICKTTHERTEDLAKFVRENHPYDEPEFLVVPVESGLDGYLRWVSESISKLL